VWKRRTAVREYLRGALWVLPTLAVVLGLAGGAAMSALPVGADSPWLRLLFQGNASDARQLLIVVSATMITVTGIVFSLTVVSLQIASSQFSVRLLRTFMRDLPNQVVLAIFVCTFAYSTGGLYTVGERAGGGTFVPRVAVSGSLWLVFLSTGALVYFLHRLVHSIQIDTIMEGVQRRTLALVDDLYPETDGFGTDRPADGPDDPPAPGPDAVEVTARRPGYLQYVDMTGLERVAAAHGVCVRIEVLVGDYVTAGARIGSCWSVAPGADGRPPDAAAARAQAELGIGFERTLQQDIRFGLRQLVDIALRALSPAVNDPYSAVQVLHHLSAIETVLAGRRIGPDVRRGPDGSVRVWLPTPGFAAYLEMVCAQVRRCGAHEPLVLAALLQLLCGVAARCTTSGRRRAVLAQTDLVASAAEQAIRQPADRALVAAAVELARDVARHPGRPEPPPSAFGMAAAAASHDDP
jgi:uncharacterized membrane protein